MEFYNILRYLRLTSQVLGSVICVFYIYKTTNYEVSWNLLTYFLPTVALKINNALSTFGTLILIIPLTIIVLSFLYPENYPLKIAGSFFGIASTLCVITFGFAKGTLHEIYNLRILIIKKILTLEEKRIIFKQELAQIIEEKYKTTLALYQYLRETLITNYAEIYDVNLEPLKERLTIKLYANDIAQNTANIFLQKHNVELQAIASKSQDILYKVIKYGAYSALTIIGVFTVFTIAHMLMDQDNLIKGYR